MGRRKTHGDETIGDKIRSVRRDVALWADKDAMARVDALLDELYAAVYTHLAENRGEAVYCAKCGEVLG